MILIVSAMESEARELVKVLKKETLFNDKYYYKGVIKDNEVCVLITGVGKTNASLYLSSILMKEKITSIINIGYAGAIGDYQVGDVVLIDKCLYGDVDVTEFTNYEVCQIPKMPLYFNSDKKLFDKCVKVINKTDLLYTQDKFVLEGTNSGLYDMEGASFYQTSYVYNKPIISIKVVSDLIGKENQIENYSVFEEKSSYIIKEIIDKIM